MRTQQVLVTAVLACSFVACVSNRGAASTAQPEPSTAPSAPAKTDSPPVDVPPLSDRTMKTVLESGEGKTYSGDGDCVTIANKFLEDWCAKTLSNTSISMKDGDLTGDDNVLVYAVIARGLLRGDRTVCEIPLIVHWEAVAAHVDDGAAACRSSFDMLTKQGTFGVTDASSGETITVVIP